jgi:protein tyrosine phosphatase
MKKPFPRSYWVEPDKLLAGYYPGDIKETNAYKKIQSLLDCGIRCFINLIDESEKNHTRGSFIPYNYIIEDISKQKNIEVVYIKTPIIDQNIPNIATMRMILDSIDSANNNGLPVYLHCWGGIGRTGIVVGCWLLRHGKANKENVFDIISDMRYSQKDPEAYREAPETEIQREFIRKCELFH